MDDDRLSELPNSLILSILSLLDMRDMVTTTFLSNQWKNRWTTVPCLHFRSRFPFSRDLLVESSNFISGALAQWKGAKILELTIFFSSDDPLIPSSDIDSWLLFATEKQVEKLTFGFVFKMHGAYFVPQCLYSCSSIKELTLRTCSLKIETNVQWNKLKSLNIRKSEGLSGDAMSQVLVGAPLLEELVLWSFEISENFNIRSTSLKILEINGCDVKAEAELRIWAPNLWSLVISASVCGSYLLYVPSLTAATLSFKKLFTLEMFQQVFRSIRHVEEVSLSDWSVQFLVEMKENDMPLQFPNAEFLRLCDFKDHQLLDVLEMFPKLKTLVVYEDGYLYNSVASEMISCSPSLLHLQTVEIIYTSYPSSISSMVKFLLENAHVLQKMVLKPYLRLKNNQEAFILALKELLGMRRSSPHAKLIINESLMIAAIPNIIGWLCILPGVSLARFDNWGIVVRDVEPESMGDGSRRSFLQAEGVATDEVVTFSVGIIQCVEEEWCGWTQQIVDLLSSWIIRSNWPRSNRRQWLY
ncbi:FBD-associated F-box protein At5g22730-like [Salvia miltiorrhiza]|uniref:FBD-associated F-box protein At5g22730-like n=1 Tax=Salvia miltiorrhiza TaxID=226208 RepID=UPI0025AD8F99|nr:FBD-associated F-box protein At5g22730-like [Salvia miltiorrhiza]